MSGTAVSTGVTPSSATSSKGLLALTIDVTERCNLRCSYCYKGGAGEACVNIKAVLAAVERLWPFVVEHGGLSVAFMGGEPLIALDELLHLAKELGGRCSQDALEFSWSVTSNLTLLTPERADRVLVAGGSFHCSVDGNPMSHDQNRPFASGRGSSSAVSRHVDLLRERGALRGVRMTITPATVGQMLDGVRHLHSLGFTAIAAFPAFDNQDWTLELMETVREQSRLIADARMIELKALTWLHPFDSYARLLSSKSDEDGTHCGACHSLLGIDIHGRIFPCHRFTGQAGWERYELQTLDGEGPGSWSQMRATFKRTVSERCRSCPALGACRGGCWAENLSATGSLEDSGNISCAYNMAMYRGIEESSYRVSPPGECGSCTFCNPCIMCDVCLICHGCNFCDNREPEHCSPGHRIGAN